VHVVLDRTNTRWRWARCCCSWGALSALSGIQCSTELVARAGQTRTIIRLVVPEWALTLVGDSIVHLISHGTSASGRVYLGGGRGVQAWVTTERVEFELIEGALTFVGVGVVSEP
jgi:hypothetical protein